MCTLLPHQLDDRGFAHHLLIPLLSILIVAGIGTWLLKLNYADNTKYWGTSCTNATLPRAGARSRQRAANR
jgi:hypothetical protein